MSIWDTDKDKIVDCTTPMTYEEYKRMTNQYCRNVAHKPMTNEEWLRQASTEELAELFYTVWVKGFFEQTLSVPEDMNNLIIEWLKSKHTNE